MRLNVSTTTTITKINSLIIIIPDRTVQRKIPRKWTPVSGLPLSQQPVLQGVPSIHMRGNEIEKLAPFRLQVAVKNACVYLGYACYHRKELELQWTEEKEVCQNKQTTKPKQIISACSYESNNKSTEQRIDRRPDIPAS